MADRIEVDTEVGARLHLVLARADGQQRRLTSIEIGEGEVGVRLLRVILPGPLRGLEGVGSLKAEVSPAVADERTRPPRTWGILLRRPIRPQL